MAAALPHRHNTKSRTSRASIVAPTFHGEAVVIATSYETSTVFSIRLPAIPNSANRRTLRSRVGEALDEGKNRIVIDCAAASELDLMVVSALVDCAGACVEKGVSFELLNLRRELRMRIQALLLAERLGIHE
jgi:anti-anti-sigma regulatory factor